MSQDFTNDLIFQALEAQRAQELADEKICSKMDGQKIEHIRSLLIEQMAKDCVSDLCGNLCERVLQERAENARFMANNEQIWGDGFLVSEMMYLIVLDAAEAYRGIFSELPDEQKQKIHYRYTAIYQLHGRACQQYLEILCLLKAGFADGAFARWRSLYELCIVAQFIAQNDEIVAKAYWGESFCKDTKKYRWARKAPRFAQSKKAIRLNDLLDACEPIIAKWEKQFGLSSEIIHASPQGTFARLGNPENLNFTPVGPSIYGLAMPAVNSACMLAIISAIFFKLLHSGDGALYAEIASSWVDKIRQVYSEIERSSFYQDERDSKT